MFQIFSGGWRGTEGQQTDITYLNVGVEFRKLLYEFKGARLAVLMCIVLHMDQEGVAFPSYDTIVKETGYGRGTVASAIADLCALKIKGRLVLMRWRERDDTGQFMGSNRYKVFPTNEEFYIQSSLFPTVEKTNGGKTELEETPDTEVTPKNKDSTPVAKSATGEAASSKNGNALPQVPPGDWQPANVFEFVLEKLYSVQYNPVNKISRSTRGHVNTIRATLKDIDATVEELGAAWTAYPENLSKPRAPDAWAGMVIRFRENGAGMSPVPEFD